MKKSERKKRRKKSKRKRFETQSKRGQMPHWCCFLLLLFFLSFLLAVVLGVIFIIFFIFFLTQMVFLSVASVASRLAFHSGSVCVCLYFVLLQRITDGTATCYRCRHHRCHRRCRRQRYSSMFRFVGSFPFFSNYLPHRAHEEQGCGLSQEQVAKTPRLLTTVATNKITKNLQNKTKTKQK